MTPTLISTLKKPLCSRSPSSQSRFFGAGHNVPGATTGDEFLIAKIPSRSPFETLATAAQIPRNPHLVSVLQNLTNHRSPFYFGVILSALNGIDRFLRLTRPLYKRQSHLFKLIN
jgi:hypothetical protein